MTGRARAMVSVLALAGLASAATSTYMHYQLVAEPGYTSFCDINETVSCTSVYESRYGSVAGIPVALGGVLWFGVALLLARADTRASASERRDVAAYFLVWSTVGLSVAMYMAFASFWVLRTFCILCGVVYVAVIGIFLLTGSGESTPLRQLPAALLRDLAGLVRRPVELLGTLALIAAVGAGAVGFRNATESALTPQAVDTSAPATLSVEEQLSEFARYWEDQPRVDLGLDPIDARVVVYKFNDYQCPACAQTHLAYDPIFLKYESAQEGSVRLVMLDFPLDPSCNAHAPNGIHDAACDAAVAARLAWEVGEAEGQRMERWLYANQQAMTTEAITSSLADIAGVDADQWAARHDEMLERVRADIEIGAALPVDATPTFVVNGVLLKGGLSPEFFDQAIAIELERATAAPE